MKKEENFIRFDWAIKRLLRNKADFKVLEGFLTTLLGEEVRITQLLESETNQEDFDNKFNRVDVMTQNRQGEYFIIEVQLTGNFDYFRRMLYATSKTITEHMKIGMHYTEVKKVYSINIIYFTLGLNDDYVYHGTTEFRGLHTQTLHRLTDKERRGFGIEQAGDVFPEYYLLCVENFNSVAKTPLDEWIEFLKTSHIPEHPQAPGLKEARQQWEVSQMTDIERRRYERYLDSFALETEKYENTYRDGKHDGLTEGLEKGLEKGREEGLAKGLEKGREEGLVKGREEGLAKGREEGVLETKRFMAQTMKQSGLDTSRIAQITGLSADDIEALA